MGIPLYDVTVLGFMQAVSAMEGTLQRGRAFKAPTAQRDQRHFLQFDAVGTLADVCGGPALVAAIGIARHR